jgi:hypothetical protein
MGGFSVLSIRWSGSQDGRLVVESVLALAGWLLLTVGLAPTLIARRQRTRKVLAAVIVMLLLAAAVMVWDAAEVLRSNVIDPTGPGVSIPLWAPALALVPVIIIAVSLLSRRVMVIFRLRERARSDFYLADTIRCVGVLGLSFALLFPVGSALENHESDTSRSAHLLSELINTTRGAASVLVELAPLVVVAYVAFALRLRRELSRSQTGSIGVAAMLSLILGLAAPWSQSGVLQFVLNVPLWLLQVLVLWLIVKRLLAKAVVQISQDRPMLLARMRREAKASAADTGAVQPPTAMPSASDSARPRLRDRAGALLLQRGPRNDVLPNAMYTARLAGFLAIAPVLYFLWTTLAELWSKVSWGTGAVILLIGVVAEAARWVVTGFVYGWVQSRLPGFIGPVKGLVFAIAWVLSCLVPTAIARALDVDLAHQFVYRSAQFALFVIVLAVAVDVATLRRAGVSSDEMLLRLQDAYDFKGYTKIVATVAPAALLVVTVGQQIAAGSGVDVAKAFLGGITGVIK